MSSALFMRVRPKIAMVVPDVTAGYGVCTVADFLYRIIEDSRRYTPYIISLATSFRDRYSVRLLSPHTWVTGYQVVQGIWHGKEYKHVGAILTELEFQRYRPRRKLTHLLQHFDLIQVVAGSPVWAYVTLPIQKPIALQVATLLSAERQTLLAREKGLKRLWFRLMTKIGSYMEVSAINHVDAVFVENQWMYNHLCTMIPESRVYFAPPGIDTDFFYPGTYQKNGYILSVGRFSDPRKNVRLLFDAYARICRTVPSAPDLVLIGKAPSPADMAYLTDLGVADRVRIYTDVSQPTLAEFYRGARLFVLSSDEEGLGLVILEAMASSLPVVSTACGGPSTSVLDGEAGFLTPIGDAVALSEAIKCLLLNPDLARRMGEAGRQRVVKRFSLRVTGQAFLNVYDELLGCK